MIPPHPDVGRRTAVPPEYTVHLGLGRAAVLSSPESTLRLLGSRAPAGSENVYRNGFVTPMCITFMVYFTLTFLMGYLGFCLNCSSLLVSHIPNLPVINLLNRNANGRLPGTHESHGCGADWGPGRQLSFCVL